MLGFCITNFKQDKITEVSDNKHIFKNYKVDNYSVTYTTLNKFMKDKVFEENNDYFILLEGVLLNKTRLLTKEKCSNLFNLIIKLYNRDGDCFCKQFRGSFSGLIINKNNNELLAFTNHYGDKPLYYMADNNHFIIASHARQILNIMRLNNKKVTLNEKAMYQMLSYGFLFGVNTYANEIKRVLPGHVLKIVNNNVILIQYYKPKESRPIPDTVSDDEFIEKIDALFRDAIRLEFDKDREYGYKHLCDLSGGLDSRMTTWVAHEMGYAPILNTTYSQQGYLDETIATQISEELGNEMIFKPLNDASFIFEAKRIISMNEGMALYSGITGGEQLLRNINFEHFGIEHTGQIGDVVIGSFLNSPTELTKICHDGAYSKKLLSKLKLPKKDNYLDREQFLFCTRAFMGTLSTHQIRQNYTEVASPFLNIDFMEYCLSIPVKKRIGHNIYKKWILSKYPNAANYIWEKTGLPINAGKLTKTFNSFKKSGYTRLINSRPFNKIAKLTISSMNPFEYWRLTNPKIEDYLNKQIEIMYELPLSKEIINDINSFKQNATCLELTQIVTAVLSAQYYLNYGSFDK